ncbi:MAG: TonB-dependent receptor plug domain-containing protein, partial [Bacteroidota bacterium]
MYVILKVGFQILVCCLSVVCVAQDSVRVLEEVDIVGIDLSKFSSGTVLQKLEASSSGSLLDIGDNTTIHFKNYGNQQLSTIAFRGTSANHTNVIWNGLQVNSPTLGQTDFSVWPYFLTDQITIQYGGGSSLFGSGAIGGSVIIDNSVMRKDSLLTLYNAYGSFGQYDGGLKFQYEISDRLTIESKGFLSKIENNFPLEGGGRQPHAGV